MRLTNLLGLRLDQHLLRPDPRKPEISAIMIGEEETKNRVPLMYPLSSRTAEILEIWLRDYRPLLVQPGNPYVFPGKGMGPMTRAGMRDAVKVVTRERIGVEINPHAFRHIAAEAFLQQPLGADVLPFLFALRRSVFPLHA
ncbi:tyrosine-type recombinase/integrase [Acidocella aromatica]|uniref:Integrase n=1 Tax=Acidocella aromatica TaxID=1303579 RepID=A0A840VPW5_9PROT|nr:tyrosine-type recombinase/integrase [Acidocella aromatica]MBB5373450.1 integrase [Acidocella aromatica]